MALTDKLTAIANAIRLKTGKADPLTLEQMATEIEGIEAGGGKAINQIISSVYFAETIVEDITPPTTLAEAKCYYNGVLLPGFTTEMLDKYPYVWIRKDNANGNYNLVFGKQPWYYDAESLLVCGDKTSLPYYSIAISSYLTATEWTNPKDAAGTDFGIAANRTVLWSNHDIPNGSAGAAEIYFEGSQPVLA